MKPSSSAPAVGVADKKQRGSRLSQTLDSKRKKQNSPSSSDKKKKGVNWKWKPPKRIRKPKPYRGSATGKYDMPGGGRFSLSKPKSYIDWEVHRAKQTPGPNSYTLPDPKPKGGVAKISDADPKSDIDWIILRSSKTPGPSQYEPKIIEPKRGVQFSDANPKSYLDWAVYNAKSIPGPGTYNIALCPYPVIKKEK